MQQIETDETHTYRFADNWCRSFRDNSYDRDGSREMNLFCLCDQPLISLFLPETSSISIREGVTALVEPTSFQLSGTMQTLFGLR